MRLIDDFRHVYPRLWVVWMIALAVVLTLAEIFMADVLSSLLTTTQVQLLQLCLLVAALVARGMAQKALRKSYQETSE